MVNNLIEAVNAIREADNRLYTQTDYVDFPIIGITNCSHVDKDTTKEELDTLYADLERTKNKVERRIDEVNEYLEDLETTVKDIEKVIEAIEEADEFFQPVLIEIQESVSTEQEAIDAAIKAYREARGIDD